MVKLKKNLGLELSGNGGGILWFSALSCGKAFLRPFHPQRRPLAIGRRTIPGRGHTIPSGDQVTIPPAAGASERPFSGTRRRGRLCTDSTAQQPPELHICHKSCYQAYGFQIIAGQRLCILFMSDMTDNGRPLSPTVTGFMQPPMQPEWQGRAML